jgi:hypothetical protein
LTALPLALFRMDATRIVKKLTEWETCLSKTVGR